MGSEIEMSTGQLIPLNPRRKYFLYILKPRLVAPQASLTIWVDMSPANTFRRHFDSPIRLTYTYLFIKAAALALEEHPEVNAVWTAGGILRLGDIRFCVPVHVEGSTLGVVDVNIENVQFKSLPMIAQELVELAAESRTKPIRHGKAELLLRLPQTIATLVLKYLTNYPPPSVKRDFVFRITNFGQWGIDRTIPANITSSPMLTAGRVADRVVVVDGVLDARPTLCLTLAYDCRVIDDTQASRFLGRLKALLENPQTLS